MHPVFSEDVTTPAFATYTRYTEQQGRYTDIADLPFLTALAVPDTNGTIYSAATHPHLYLSVAEPLTIPRAINTDVRLPQPHDYRRRRATLL